MPKLKKPSRRVRQRPFRGGPPVEGRWQWQSHDAHDRALLAAGTSGLAVYVALCRLESEAPMQFKASFFASEANIARHSQLSARRLRPIVRTLERAGLLTIVRPAGKARLEHQANRYTITRSGQNVRPGADTMSEPERTNTGAKMSAIEEVHGAYSPNEQSPAAIAAPGSVEPARAAANEWDDINS